MLNQPLLFKRSVIILSILFCLILLLFGITAVLQASQPVCPIFPIDVANELELNEAITCFNVLTDPGTHQINFTGDIFLTTAAQTISNTTSGVALLVNGDNHTLSGGTVMDARPFTIQSSQVTIKDLTITEGFVTDAGGAISATNSTLDLQRTLILGNYAYSDTVTTRGGGLYLSNSTTTITESFVGYNQASGTEAFGGGIALNEGVLSIINSTLGENRVASDNLARGGGIFAINEASGSVVTLTNSTVYANQADGSGIILQGGGVFADNVNLTLHNSIIAGSLTEGVLKEDCKIKRDGVLTANNSLLQDTDASGACGLTAANPDANGNIVGEDPQMLGLTGMGSTFFYPFAFGSPVQDAGADSLAVDGNNNPLTTDQRGAGFQRIFDTAVDMGAIEYQCPTFPVDVATDQALAHAILCFNQQLIPATYQINLTSDIFLTQALPAINNSTTGVKLDLAGNHFMVNGAGVAAGFTHIFHIMTDSVVSMNQITVTGHDDGYTGAGFYISGEITLTNSTVSDNWGSYGVGIGVIEGGKATIVNSTITGNHSDIGAAGVGNYRGEVTLINSTVSGNVATDPGNFGTKTAGVWVQQGIITITYSTVANNQIFDNNGIASGSGIWSDAGTVILEGSIVADNTPASNCGSVFGGTFTSNGYNLSTDASCNLTATGDITNGVAALGPLADNGGDTLTHALLAGSQALNSIPAGVCTQTHDQRGIPRPQYFMCDMGSYEKGWRLVITAVSPSNAELSWEAPGPSCTYDIFESTTPYFTPAGSPDYTTGSLMQLLTGKLGNTSTNYFYINRATCDALGTTTSNEVGEFDFAIVPGTS